MSRSSNGLTGKQDAFGHLLSDYQNGEKPEWGEHQKLAIAHATGHVLDIGCGAGRHSLYLQQQGHNVLATDISPVAIQLCQQRGLKNGLVMPITQLNSKLGMFNTILMMGHNFGLVGSYKRARWLLKRFAAMTTADAMIIAETMDPYQTTEPGHLAYHQYNRDRGRMSGQLRLRIRYKQFTTPWFDYLFVSKPELEDILIGTSWTIERYIDSDKPTYVAIFRKRVM